MRYVGADRRPASVRLQVAFESRVERRKSTDLLALSKIYLAAIVEVLTAHCPTGTHAVRQIIILHTSCQSDMKKGEVETYFLLHYSAFARLWLKNIGSLTFGEPGAIAENGITYFNKFVIGSKSFVNL